MSVNYNPKIVTNGLIMLIDPANQKSYSGSGNTTIDITNTGYNGNLTNSITYTGAAFNFSRAANSVIVIDSIIRTAQTAATFLSFIQRNGTQASYAGILFNRGGSAVGVNGINLGAGGNLFYHWNNQANTYQFASGLTTPNNQWCMVAASIDANGAVLYVNTNSASNIQPLPAVTYGNILRIGADATQQRYFNGNISTTMLYSRALTDAEIKQNFNALRGRFGI